MLPIVRHVEFSATLLSHDPRRAMQMMSLPLTPFLTEDAQARIQSRRRLRECFALTEMDHGPLVYPHSPVGHSNNEKAKLAKGVEPDDMADTFYGMMPPKMQSLAMKAHTEGQKALDLVREKHVSHDKKAKANRYAHGCHVAVALEMAKDGFVKQAQHHLMLAGHHEQYADAHDAADASINGTKKVSR